ncbi:UNVERIFIED_CONTAM: hypothetical protein Sradi_6900700 [Sesamum radiatum]|uniref:Uncharacterized protein n=1 Tax=Sesamum radiatum TaxID=300843 RepID=A0AAW2JHG4_SESRA
MALDLKNNAVSRELHPTILCNIPLRPCNPRIKKMVSASECVDPSETGGILQEVHHMSEAPRVTEAEPKRAAKCCHTPCTTVLSTIRWEIVSSAS